MLGVRLLDSAIENMYWSSDCAEQKQTPECLMAFAQGDLGRPVLTNDDRRSTELSLLQNILNNNIYSCGAATSLPHCASTVMTANKFQSSSPTKPSAAGVPASTPGSNKLAPKCDRYKTELCRTYEENGTCRYGDKCQFAHGAAELRTVVRHPKYKTDLCRTFHTTGFCPYGSRCHFIHSLQERQRPPRPATLPVQTSNLLLPQLSVKLTELPSMQVKSVAAGEKQSLDNALQTLSSLMHANHLSADHITANILAQEYARKLAAEYPSHHSSVSRSLSQVSDITAMSMDSASPCPSPTSAHDDLLPCYFTNHVPLNACFQSQAMVPAGFLTPPSSPGSAASSLASHDYDGSDWPRNVWPGLLSPVKNVDISSIPDFAHSRSVFA